MRFEVFKNWDDLLKYREIWNSLAERSTVNSIFQTFEWHQAWIKVFDPSLKIVLGFDADRLRLIAPLESFLDRRYGLSLRLIGTGNYFSDYADLIYASKDVAALRAFFDFITAENWNQFDLFNLVQDSDTLSLVPKLAKESSLNLFMRRLYSAPTSHLSDPVRAKEICNKDSLKRHSKGLSKRGLVQFKHLTSREEILSRLPTFFSQHQGRRELVSDRSLFDLEANKDFYKTLVNTLDPAKTLRFSELTLNSVPVAFHFGFEFNRRLIWYKPAFDAALSRLSPGEVLLKNLFEYSIEHGLSELDFGVGDEKFKFRFANERRAMHRIILFRKRSDLLIERILLIGRRLKAAVLGRLG